MKTYRLELRRHGSLLGHFESDSARAMEVIREISRRLDGYDLSLLVAESERRILESGPDGIRLLGSERLFAPAPPGLID